MFFKKRKNRPRFAAGDKVTVKSRESIAKLIQPDGKLDGCLFTDQMWDYCGNAYTVLKVVDHIFNEHRQRTFKTKPNLYILDGLVCNGKTSGFPHNCDHCCLLLWHEDWLEKLQ
jgi:hypothetical protein